MQITKTKKIIIGIIVASMFLGVYIYVDIKSRKAINSPSNTTDQTISTTTEVTTSVSNIQGTGGYTVTQVSETEGRDLPQPIPDLNRKIILSSGVLVAPEAQALATEKISLLQVQLKKDMANLKAWINLGIYQKMAGDYQGAILSWQYASKLAPSDYVSLGNIANLYAYFLHNNAQAEIYYKKAIANGPTQAYLYIQLAEVYRDVFHDTAKAKAIITEGLAKNPNNKSLLEAQANLSK